MQWKGNLSEFFQPFRKPAFVLFFITIRFCQYYDRFFCNKKCYRNTEELQEGSFSKNISDSITSHQKLNPPLCLRTKKGGLKMILQNTFIACFCIFGRLRNRNIPVEYRSNTKRAPSEHSVMWIPLKFPLQFAFFCLFALCTSIDLTTLETEPLKLFMALPAVPMIFQLII